MRFSVVLPLCAGIADDGRVAAVSRLVDELGDGETLVVPYGPDASSGSYAEAANAAAGGAGGETLIFFRDTIPTSADALEALLRASNGPQLGVVGGRLRQPNGELQPDGLLLRPSRLSLRGFEVFRTRSPVIGHRAEDRLLPYDAVSLHALATPRALFLELGGFEETFGDVCEDLDYCLRVGERGLRVAVAAGASFASWPSAARVPAPHAGRAERAFALRWRDRANPIENQWCERTGYLRREDWNEGRLSLVLVPLPETTVFVHGPAPADREAFAAQLFRSRLAPNEVIWGTDGPAPRRAREVDDRWAALLAATEARADRYVAFVRTDTQLAPDWLNLLVDAIEFAVDTVAATATIAGAEALRDPPASVDARCTLVALRLVPQHLRIAPAGGVDRAVGRWIADAAACGRAIRAARGAVATLGAPPAQLAVPAAVAAARDELASIVMLSWNAPEFTELAVDSIREHTHVPHEIVIVDNGSNPETLARLDRIEGVRTIRNPRNTGFAYGSNQGIAAARGSHVVLLNNDVVVTAGWLEALLAVLRRNPAVGVSAPRSNRVSGPQQVDGVPYGTIPAMHAYAAYRAAEQRGRFARHVRAAGLCLCIDRRVIDEVGGFDPRFGIGNWEDDDLCLRIRAAGYEIAICEDAFVHHFGSVSFRANNVDYQALIRTNMRAMLGRWALSDANVGRGQYDPLPAIRRGFRRATDYIALPSPEPVADDWVIGSWA